MYGLIVEFAFYLYFLCGRYECFIGNEVFIGELWFNGLIFVKL